MSRLVPTGFLTIPQAAERLAVAIFAGMPDRPLVTNLRESGFDVADGAAIDDAVSKIWAAVDRRKAQAFVVGARQQAPLKLSSEMSKGIPGLRSPRGGDFNFLRPTNPLYKQFLQWFGIDMSTVTAVVQETEITRLSRTLFRARRRHAVSAGAKRVGRPSRQVEIEPVLREVIDHGQWSPTQSVKVLTQQVNRRGKWAYPVSEDTIVRILDRLGESGDRRFERVRRQKGNSNAGAINEIRARLIRILRQRA